MRFFSFLFCLQVSVYVEIVVLCFDFRIFDFALKTHNIICEKEKKLFNDTPNGNHSNESEVEESEWKKFGKCKSKQLFRNAPTQNEARKDFFKKKL
jgi:hypothetical protein